jgi:hypothetical protein
MTLDRRSVRRDAHSAGSAKKRKILNHWQSYLLLVVRPRLLNRFIQAYLFFKRKPAVMNDAKAAPMYEANLTRYNRFCRAPTRT